MTAHKEITMNPNWLNGVIILVTAFCVIILIGVISETDENK